MLPLAGKEFGRKPYGCSPNRRQLGASVGFLCGVGHLLFTSAVFPSAPGQPPLNVEWNLIGSKLTVHWESVISLEMESEVTGYQVSASQQCNPQRQSIRHYIHIILLVSSVPLSI